MGVMALISSVILLVWKRTTVYGSIVLGITVFTGLFLLDTLVLTRCLDIMPSFSGHKIDLAAEYDRLINGGAPRRIEELKNVLAFIPFGFFLSELLSSTKRFGPWHRLGYVALIAFGLSLCIETLQLLLSIGFFEVTDLVTNTVGGGVGASLALLVRRFLRS